MTKKLKRHASTAERGRGPSERAAVDALETYVSRHCMWDGSPDEVRAFYALQDADIFCELKEAMFEWTWSAVASQCERILEHCDVTGQKLTPELIAVWLIRWENLRCVIAGCEPPCRHTTDVSLDVDRPLNQPVSGKLRESQ